MLCSGRMNRNILDSGWLHCFTSLPPTAPSLLGRCRCGSDMFLAPKNPVESEIVRLALWRIHATTLLFVQANFYSLGQPICEQDQNSAEDLSVLSTTKNAELDTISLIQVCLNMQITYHFLTSQSWDRYSEKGSWLKWGFICQSAKLQNAFLFRVWIERTSFSDWNFQRPTHARNSQISFWNQQ